MTGSEEVAGSSYAGTAQAESAREAAASGRRRTAVSPAVCRRRADPCLGWTVFGPAFIGYSFRVGVREEGD